MNDRYEQLHGAYDSMRVKGFFNGLLGRSCVVGSIIIETDATLNINGGPGDQHAFLSAVDVQNSGAIDLDSAGSASGLLTTGAILNNGRIEVHRGSSGPRSITGDIINRGQFVVAVDYSFQKSDSGRFFRQEGGTLDCGGGFSLLSQSFSYDGGTVLGEPLLNSCTLALHSPESLSVIVQAGSMLTTDVGANHSVWIQGYGGQQSTYLTTVGSLTIDLCIVK